MNPALDPVVENDVVLIHIEDKPEFFARVEGFTADTKPNWWHVKLLILQVPLMVVTWILRREQINGEEFTMQGRPIRIEKVIAPQIMDIPPEVEQKLQKNPTQQNKEKVPAKSGKQARILSLGGKNNDNS